MFSEEERNGERVDLCNSRTLFLKMSLQTLLSLPGGCTQNWDRYPALVLYTTCRQAYCVAMSSEAALMVVGQTISAEAAQSCQGDLTTCLSS
ncbi:hypothetical protein TNCV_165651 [Trichonephila clavipes]|nr:hypothetical protein TNCV_165651 [Trichonephila clavipes]